MPVIAVAPNDELLEKLKSNLHEVRARGGELYVFTDSAAYPRIQAIPYHRNANGRSDFSADCLYDSIAIIGLSRGCA